jgi:small redox-active disulfide protein 2
VNKKMLKIEVLGPGCPKCDDTHDKVKLVLDELKIEAELVKVTDVFKIIDRGICVTPAMILDGKIAFQGKVPTTEMIRELIKNQITSKIKPN